MESQDAPSAIWSRMAVTGILVPPGDSVSLAQATISLLADKSKAHEMGEAGREKYLKLFTIRRMIQGIEAIISEQSIRAKIR